MVFSGDGVGNSCRQQRIERLNSIQFYLNINIKNYKYNKKMEKETKIIYNSLLSRIS